MSIEQRFDSVRIDKWLWAVRVCKTRAVAIDLCKRQRVEVNGQLVKSSRLIRVGDHIGVKRDGIQWQYCVLKCIDKRVGASVASTCREDCTPQDVLNKLAVARASWVPRRDKGEGRPTKKDRRAIDKLYE